MVTMTRTWNLLMTACIADSIADASLHFCIFRNMALFCDRSLCDSVCSCEKDIISAAYLNWLDYDKLIKQSLLHRLESPIQPYS